jgi:hypothetical protein
VLFGQIAHDHVVTTAVIAPTRTKQLLSDVSSRSAIAAACIIVTGDYMGNIRVFVNSPPDIKEKPVDLHGSQPTSVSSDADEVTGRPSSSITAAETAPSTFASFISAASRQSFAASTLSGSSNLSVNKARSIKGSAASIYSVARSEISIRSHSQQSLNTNSTSYLTALESQRSSDREYDDAMSTRSGITPPALLVTRAPSRDADAVSVFTQATVATRDGGSNRRVCAKCNTGEFKLINERASDDEFAREVTLLVCIQCDAVIGEL